MYPLTSYLHPMQTTLVNTRFHLLRQQPCKVVGSNKSAYIRRYTNLRFNMVLGHQYGCHDGMLKCSIQCKYLDLSYLSFNLALLSWITFAIAFSRVGVKIWNKILNAFKTLPKDSLNKQMKTSLFQVPDNEDSYLHNKTKLIQLLQYLICSYTLLYDY